MSRFLSTIDLLLYFQKMKEKMSKLKTQRNLLNLIKKGDAFTNSMNSICEVLSRKQIMVESY